VKCLVLQTITKSARGAFKSSSVLHHLAFVGYFVNTTLKHDGASAGPAFDFKKRKNAQAVKTASHID
jgi:hypothetical protein